ncbi:MAG TPA: hypothetical protein VMJ32_12325 [Pirellulales bacterium]|nr:hypothetical protein [Pirellulales bacterium]
MVFEHIEKLKRAFTDKYVVVDASRPELARFGNATGLIKTVNMNGRALVEFDQFDNIGWYDIELDFLKVVPKPEPKAKEEKPAPEKKVAAEKTPAAPKTAAAKPAAPAAGGKPSTADILAAARVKKGTGEPVSAATPSATKSAPAAKPPAATPTAAAPAAKKAPGAKLSTADILAMARGKGAAAAPAASAAAPSPVSKPAAKPAVKSEPEPAPLTPEEAEQPVAEAAPVVEPAKPVKKSSAGPKPTTTAEKIAYCRQVDSK